MGDYKSTLFSVTPGLHSQLDLIYVPNICLRWHKRMHAQWHAGMRSYVHAQHSVITVVTHAVSVSSNFITCIIHRYFNLMRIIRHFMPKLLKQGDQEGEGGGDHVHVWQYEFLSGSCPRSRGSCAPALPLKPPPPAVSTDYYYGNPLAYACKAAVCETGKLTALPHTFMSFIGFSCVMKAHKCRWHNPTGTEHSNMTLKGNTWLKLWDICLHGKWKLSANGKKAESHYLGCVYFTLC